MHLETTSSCLHQTALTIQSSEKQMLSINLQTVRWTKATGSSVSRLICARSVSAPAQRVIHSDFDLFWSYLIMSVVFFFLFYSFVSYFVCFCFHSTCVVSPARPVGKYPSL